METNAASKRPRRNITPLCDVQDVVANFHRAVTSQQRLDMLQHFLDELGYDPTTKRCTASTSIFVSLVDAGVINALCLQMGFVISRHGSTKIEIELICNALAAIFVSCPHQVIQNSLSTVGPDLFPLILRVLSWEIILPVISILHSCSASNRGTEMFMKCRGSLPSLVDIISYDKLETECLLEALGLLKNLTYYAEDYRLFLIEYPGFLPQLNRIAFSDVCEKGLERLSAIFRNLAVSLNTRMVLAQQSELISALLRMASHPNRKILRNVLNMLLSLAMEADSCVLLALHGDGMILALLKRLMSDDEDQTVRKRAARILRLMACDTSAPLLIHDSCLMEALSCRALNDASTEVRTEATEAFARFSCAVKAPMPQHEAVLDALTHLACSPTVLPEVLARVFKEQAGYPANRIPMADRNTLLEALARIATSLTASNASKEDVCCALVNLSYEDANKNKIATDAILEALVQNSGGSREDHSRKRDFAVRALLNLALSPSNRKKMVKHTSLLQSLIQYASSATTDDLKREVKKTILTLVAEL